VNIDKQERSTTGEIYGDFIIWTLPFDYHDGMYSVKNFALAISLKDEYLDEPVEGSPYNYLKVDLSQNEDMNGISFDFGGKSKFVKEISLNRLVIKDISERDRKGYKVRIRAKATDWNESIAKEYQDSDDARNIFATWVTKLSKIRTMDDFNKCIKRIKKYLISDAD